VDDSGDGLCGLAGSCRGTGKITAWFQIKSEWQCLTPITSQFQASGSAARVQAFIAPGPILNASFNPNPSIQPADKQAVVKSDTVYSIPVQFPVPALEPEL